jgi:uncharacterized protein (DUF427 family)
MSLAQDQYITITREARPVTVHFNDNVLASTKDALILREGSYDPVYYIPKAHVAMEFLLPTDRHTTCPHKGVADYWTVSAGGAAAESAVWGYPNPKPDVSAIAGHVAFYPSKVRIEVG